MVSSRVKKVPPELLFPTNSLSLSRDAQGKGGAALAEVPFSSEPEVEDPAESSGEEKTRQTAAAVNDAQGKGGAAFAEVPLPSEADVADPAESSDEAAARGGAGVPEVPLVSSATSDDGQES